MRSNPFYFILWSFVIGFGIYFTIRYLWPLLLIIAVIAVIGILQLRRNVKEQEAQMEETLRQQREPTYQDQLFREQARRRREEDAEVIDVEFTRKEEKEGERNDSGRG